MEVEGAKPANGQQYRRQKNGNQNALGPQSPKSSPATYFQFPFEHKNYLSCHGGNYREIPGLLSISLETSVSGKGQSGFLFSALNPIPWHKVPDLKT
jgi:hypothetical protein